MELRILDENFRDVVALDAFKSLLWTDRYYQAGDFELYTEVNISILQRIKQKYYIIQKNSNSTMIVEDIQTDTDIELGDFVKFTGRSLESILDRRIVWGMKSYKGNLQNGIEMLLNENIINPSDPKRKIDNFIFEPSDDEAVTSLTIDKQWTGDNLYDIVCDLCSENDIGFRITLNSYNQFIFKLYAGVDRTYDQSKNPYVIFSPNFENLVNSDYYESNADYKNIALIAGEGEGDQRIYTTYDEDSGSGLDRRELFVDARDLQKHDYESNKDLSDSEYDSKLKERGKEKLDEHDEIVSFEGEVEARINYVYGKDFFVGDIVQLENEYGKEGETRILEVVTSLDNSGYSIYPTFVMI